MTGKRVIKIEPITNADAKGYIEYISKDFEAKQKELPYELQQTKEYLTKFAKKTEQETIKKLKELNIPEKVLIELVNARPKHEESIKTILLKKMDFDDNIVKKIQEAFS